jgi:senataxin
LLTRIIKQIPKSTHLFCPKLDDEDTHDSLYLDEDNISQYDTEDLELAKLLREGARRREMVVSCFECFSWQGPGAVGYQDMLKRRVDHDLQKCNVCIIYYYRKKREFFEKLLE